MSGKSKIQWSKFQHLEARRSKSKLKPKWTGEKKLTKKKSEINKLYNTGKSIKSKVGVLKENRLLD